MVVMLYDDLTHRAIYTEVLESVCENNAKSLERMSATKPPQPVDVPAATLSRYVGVYDVADGSGEKTVVDVSFSGSTLWLDYGSKGKEQLIVDFATPAGAAGTLLLHYAEGSESGRQRAK
jgi:hypothetical protein